MTAKWESWRNSQGELWLNVASSYLALPDFVNFDHSVWLTMAPAWPVLRHVLSPGHARAVKGMADARRSATVVSRDCTKALPVPDSSVDHILCSHFLEHVPPPVAERILVGFRRALRPGGTLHVVLPDLRYHVDQYVAGELDADGLVAATMLRSLGGDGPAVRALEAVGGLGLHHQWMYDRASATVRVTAAGLLLDDAVTPSSEFRANDPESLHLTARKPLGP